jgi:hypothetical protein
MAPSGRSTEPEQAPRIGTIHALVTSMRLDALRAVIRDSGGGENALACAEALFGKVNRLETAGQYAPLLRKLCAARNEGALRGHVLEVNFADHFARNGIALQYSLRQGMPGDIDFCWKIDYRREVFIELKLLRQDKHTSDEISAQLDANETFAMLCPGDVQDIVRLQRDVIEKASTRKFSPRPKPGAINLVAVDVSELQQGMIDVCDLLLASGGVPLASRYCDHATLRAGVVGVFEKVESGSLSSRQQDWITRVHGIPESADHPRDYLPFPRPTRDRRTQL